MPVHCGCLRGKQCENKYGVERGSLRAVSQEGGGKDCVPPAVGPHVRLGPAAHPGCPAPCHGHSTLLCPPQNWAMGVVLQAGEGEKGEMVQLRPSAQEGRFSADPRLAGGCGLACSLTHGGCPPGGRGWRWVRLCVTAEQELKRNQAFSDKPGAAELQTHAHPGCPRLP